MPPLQGELAISAAVLAELHFGVLVTTDGATGSLLPPLWLPAVSRDLVMDLLIAATAHAHSARL